MVESGDYIHVFSHHLKFLRVHNRNCLIYISRKQERIRQGKDEEEEQESGDDDAEWYRQEVGVAPDPGEATNHMGPILNYSLWCPYLWLPYISAIGTCNVINF